MSALNSPSLKPRMISSKITFGTGVKFGCSFSLKQLHDTLIKGRQEFEAWFEETAMIEAEIETAERLPRLASILPKMARHAPTSNCTTFIIDGHSHEGERSVQKPYTTSCLE